MADDKRNVCRLCGHSLTGKDKIKSHALTNATYGRPLNKGGQSMIFSREFYGEDAGHHTTELAFCATCEKKFSKWEEEREKLFSSEVYFYEDAVDRPALNVSGFNAEYIKMACITDIYRCSVFEDGLYDGIVLGEHHSKNIQKILLQGEAPSIDDYPVLLCKFNEKSKIIKELCKIPECIKFPTNGIRFYRTIAPRGWLWFIKVDSRLCPELEDFCLGCSDDIMIVNAGDFCKHRDFNQLRILLHNCRS